MQWAAISVSTLIGGVLGGELAERRSLHWTFFLAAGFPLISFVMAARYLREPQTRFDAAALRATWRSIRAAATHREVWVVSAFIFFYDFNPSFGPAFLYYQTDVLQFSQRFIGVLTSLQAVTGILGAGVYAPLSRRVPLRRLIIFSIGLGVASTLAYLAYRGPVSAVIIDGLWGGIAMIVQLSILDLAAKACPKGVEGTFFALYASVYNGAVQLSTNVGSRLYDTFGYTPLVLISAALTAFVWVLVPLVKIDRIDAAARRDVATIS